MEVRLTDGTKFWSDSMERRLVQRTDSIGPCSIIFADKVHVFGRTRNVSEHGASVQLPANYRMRVGEEFTLAAPCLKQGPMSAVVISQDGPTMGCKFL
jgi:hypothetical protein